MQELLVWRMLTVLHTGRNGTFMARWGIVCVSALGIFLMGKFLAPQALRWAMISAFALGLFLSLCSALVVSLRSSGFISNTLIPELLWLDYGEQGGWPCRFFVIAPSSKRIFEISELNPVRLFFNTIFWSLPCFLIFVLTQYCFQDWLLKATWHQSIFVLILLAPAIYELLHVSVHMLALFHLPLIPLPSLGFALANWLSNYSVDTALWFIKIVYSTFVGLALTLLFMDLSDRQGILPWHYPLFAVGLLLCVHLTDFLSLRTYLQQKLDRPFTIDSILIVSRKNDADYTLEYKLIFPQLPQEHVIYEIQCAAYDWLRGIKRHWRWHKGHYVKQIGEVIYEKADGTHLGDKQFVQQEALHGTIAIHSKTLPKYFFVSIGEYAKPSIKKPADTEYHQWYLVPLTEDMIVDGPLFDE